MRPGGHVRTPSLCRVPSAAAALNYTFLLLRTHEQAVHIRYVPPPSSMSSKARAQPRASASASSITPGTASPSVAVEPVQRPRASAPRRPARAAPAAGAPQRASTRTAPRSPRTCSRRITRAAMPRPRRRARRTGCGPPLPRCFVSRLRDVVQQRGELQQRGRVAPFASSPQRDTRASSAAHHAKRLPQRIPHPRAFASGALARKHQVHRLDRAQIACSKTSYA